MGVQSRHARSSLASLASPGSPVKCHQVCPLLPLLQSMVPTLLLFIVLQSFPSMNMPLRLLKKELLTLNVLMTRPTHERQPSGKRSHMESPTPSFRLTQRFSSLKNPSVTHQRHKIIFVPLITTQTITDLSSLKASQVFEQPGPDCNYAIGAS